MEFRRLPICVFAFERVQYLRATLDSLRVAMAEAGMAGPVALFLDGAWNPHSGQFKADLAAIAACREAFQDAMPHGVVFAAETNLGIAANIDRGERWAFETMGYPAALFFEDDMVVAPGYFRAMAGLYRLATAQQRIAMFAAYGADMRLGLAEQAERRALVGPMHHNWGFGLMRAAWLRRETLTRDYMAIVSGCDYRDRPLDRIAAWYGRMGWPPLPTTQDIAKSVALNTLGLARIASVAVCARNIGESGTHYTPQQFHRMGFAETMMLDSPSPDTDWTFAPVDDAMVDAIVAGQRAEMLRVRLGAEAFIGSTALIAALRVIRHLGADALLPPSGAGMVTSASGFYPDCWSYPVATLVIAAAAELRAATLEAIAAQHLPAGTTLDMTVNGQSVGSVWLQAGQPFCVELTLPATFDGLEKVLTARCAVSSDPFSAGFNQDRRPLAFLLQRLTLVAADGTVTIIAAREVVGGGG